MLTAIDLYHRSFPNHTVHSELIWSDIGGGVRQRHKTIKNYNNIISVLIEVSFEIFWQFTCSLLLMLSRWLSQPICLNSPIIFATARFTSCSARCVLRHMVECNALNHMSASCESLARNMHEWMPSGECNSMHRFSAFSPSHGCVVENTFV